MANVIRIKRSTTQDTPTTLEQGELAYSEQSGDLFIGKAEVNNSPTQEKIGGQSDVAKLALIEASATADQTASEIKTLLEDGIDSVHYVDGSINTVHIDDDQVTYAKIQNNIILGRDSASAGVIEEITPSSLRTMINVEDDANNYSLTTASDTDLGGIKVGDNLSITDGVLAAEAGIGTKGVDIASATTITIPTTGDYFDVTGTAIITGMTVAADRHFTLQFDGAVTLTHNATSLILPNNGSNITPTAAGDVATFQTTSANNVKCINYEAKSGSPLSWPRASLLTDENAGISGTGDRLIYQDGNLNAPKRKHINEFSLGQFNNDQNWNNYSLIAATNTVIGGMYTGTSSGINLSTSGVTAGQIFLKVASVAEKGGIRLMSDTQQSVTAESVSATANRTYALQINNISKALVNVPWTDTNTMGSGFTVSATTDTNATTITQGDDLMFIAGTGITCETTADGTVTITAGPLALTSVQTAASQITQLALTTEEGDVVVRSDEGKTYIHNGGSAGTMADFTLLSTPTSDITNVAVTSPITGGGSSGSVTIGHSTAAGNKHVPTGGDTGQFLGYSSSGTATWTDTIDGGTF